MDFNSTLDLIIKDLADAREIIDDLKKYPGVPMLQVELAKSKCKSAAEIIALLKDIKESQAPAVQETIKPVDDKKELKDKIVKPVEENQELIKKTEKPVEETQTKDITVQTFIPDMKEIPDTSNEVVELKKVEIKTEETEINTTAAKNNEKKNYPVKEKKLEAVWRDEPVKKEEPAPVRTLESIEKQRTLIEKKTTIIADRFRHTDDDSPGLHNAKRFTSLSDAIGINDSFLFIREIFNDNKATYTEAIIKLDKAESIKDAKAIIMSYTGSNIENEAVDQLLYLIKRKLLLHE